MTLNNKSQKNNTHIFIFLNYSLFELQLIT